MQVGGHPTICQGLLVLAVVSHALHSAYGQGNLSADGWNGTDGNITATSTILASVSLSPDLHIEAVEQSTPTASTIMASDISSSDLHIEEVEQSTPASTGPATSTTPTSHTEALEMDTGSHPDLDGTTTMLPGDSATTTDISDTIVPNDPPADSYLEAVDLNENFDPKKEAPSDYYRGGRAVAFLGIPYAHLAYDTPEALFSYAIPVTRDRSRTNSITQAQFGAVCPQFENRLKEKVIGSPFCLNLNIFSPINENGVILKKNPVFLYFHGGELVRGASNDLGVNGIVHNLVRRNITVVTANYRLGALGFYHFHERYPRYPLRGLHDQLLALHFVYTNIDYTMGGDVERITIGGHDASACTVALIAMLGMNPANKIQGIPIGQMYKRVSLMGGSSNYCRQYISSVSDRYREKLCDDEQSELVCMVAKSYKYLVKATLDLFPPSWKLTLGVNEYLQPSQLMANAVDVGDAPGGPKSFLIGVNTHEFAGIFGTLNSTTLKTLFGISKLLSDAYDSTTLAHFLDHMHKLELDIRSPHSASPKNQEFARNLTTIYATFLGYSEKDLNTSSTKRVDLFLRILTDAFFTVGALNDARGFTKAGNSVYLYRFNFKPTDYRQRFVDSWVVEQLCQWAGGNLVPAGVEIPYLFMQDRYLNHTNTAAHLHYPMAKLMGDVWERFIKDGKVTPYNRGGQSQTDFGLFLPDANSQQYIQLGGVDKHEEGDAEAPGSKALLHYRYKGFIPDGVEEMWNARGVNWDPVCGEKGIC